MTVKNPAYDLRFVYESQIRPLLDQISEICDQHKLPFATYFQVAKLYDGGEGFTTIGQSYGGMYGHECPVVRSIKQITEQDALKVDPQGGDDGLSKNEPPVDLNDLIRLFTEATAKAGRPPDFLGAVAIKSSDLRQAFEKGGEDGVKAVIRDAVMSNILDHARQARGRA